MSHVLRAAVCGALAIGLFVGAAPTALTEAVEAAAHQQQIVLKKQARKASSAARKVARAVKIAVAQKGDPYRYGASGPHAFDCSGLTYYAYRKAGFKKMPRTSAAQSHFVKRIKRSGMRRGDLIFFYGRGGVYHVGVYAGFSQGRRWLLHAPHTGTRVRTEGLWTDKWFPGTLRFR